ncbi:MAG: hypothetical protein AB1546_08155 [bacterium]
MGAKQWQIIGSLILWTISGLIAYRIRKKKTPEGEDIKLFPLLLTTVGLYLSIAAVVMILSILGLVVLK